MEHSAPHQHPAAGDHESSEEVCTLQKDLNQCAVRFRLPVIVEDGELGPKTGARYDEIVWRLGVFPTKEIPRDRYQDARAAITDPPSRTAEQLGRERLRALRLGPPVAAKHVVLGVRMLKLIGDLDMWVHRRVETHSFSPDDATVFLRKRSVDFSLPSSAVVGFAEDEGETSAACAVPITFANKWRLPRFDIRDESNRTLPLMAREEHGPIAVGMLIVLASEACDAGLPPDTIDIVPIEIENEFRAIVYEEPDIALGICDRLGARAVGADTPAGDADRVMRWRRALVTDETFMELAYELAQHFLIVVLCSPPLDARRILKISYELSVAQPARKGLGPRARERYAKVKQWKSGDTWLRPGGRQPNAVGTLILSSTCETLTIGSRDTGVTAAQCAAVTVVTPEGRTETVILSTQDVKEIRDMPEGNYELHVDALPGFQLMSENIVRAVVDHEQPVRATIRCSQLHVVAKRPLTTAIPVPTDGWRRRISRGLAWRSKLVLIKLRLGEGGSYHFEFEAPPGLQVTRAKVADDRRGELDILLRSVQRVHLYVPAALSEPSTGYALLNIRPRADTVARGATLTSVIATLGVLAVAIHWQVTGNAGSNGIALLLGLPGVLSAYFAYAVPSSVANTMLSGLRLVAFAPGIMAFGAAALVLDGDAQSWALILLELLFLAMVAVTGALGLAWTFSAHPREQQSTSDAQSPGFANRYLA